VSSSCENPELVVVEDDEVQEDALEDQMQASALKFL
jgi:hypothetical protein